MSKQRIEVILLCEDKQHQSFVQEYLKRSSFKIRNIRPIGLSDGRGSGEQMVRENFKAQVDVYRKYSARGTGGLVLIVVLDADKGSVQDRVSQLNKTLNKDRRPDDKIVIFVPKRNIETWVEYARTGAADEETDYKQLNQTAKMCKEAAKQFAEQICPAGLPENAPPSLFTACEELNRII